MAISEHQLRKEDDMRKMFNEMSNVRENGARKYTHEYVISVIAEKFYYSNGTVSNILRGGYDGNRRRRASNKKACANVF